MKCNSCGSNNKDKAIICLNCGKKITGSKLPIQFAYICQKKFDELKGDSNYKRNCDVCSLDVINFDILNEKERIEIFEQALDSSNRLCISVTNDVENTQRCPGKTTSAAISQSPPRPPQPRPTAGLPKIPPKEILMKEKKIIEKESKKSLYEKIKSLFWN